MNLAVALILLIIGGILLYSGFKGGTIQDAIAALNDSRKNPVKTDKATTKASTDTSKASKPV